MTNTFIYPTQSGYRWYILALATITNCLVAAVPGMCMSVLFPEISADLDLNLVQVGTVWGIVSLPGVVTILLGGAIGDRFGPKRVLLLSCLLVGLTGALRGLSFNFLSLLATMLLYGVFSPFITMNTFKACGMWFSSKQIGLASGFTSMGMALGFLLSSILSATVLSPALGGWRNVLYLYGGLSAMLAVPWFFVRQPVLPETRGVPAVEARSLRQNLVYVARIRNIWLFGLAIFGISGCIQSMLGYLPTYLRGLGWTPVSADSAVGSFHTFSLIFAIPIAMLSDRLGSRKKILIPAALLITLGVGLLSMVEDGAVWIVIGMAGFVRDGFMAVFMTSILETDGVGPAYAGTATGMVMVFSSLGNLLAPPMGNSLAVFGQGMPFVLWAALAAVGIAGILATKERSLFPQVPVGAQVTVIEE